jgi:hypothetical protein
LRNCEQFRDRCATDLPGATEDDCGEILIHREDLCLGEDATGEFIPRGKDT